MNKKVIRSEPRDRFDINYFRFQHRFGGGYCKIIIAESMFGQIIWSFRDPINRTKRAYCHRPSEISEFIIFRITYDHTKKRERESESYGQRRLKICFVESFVPPFLEKKLFLERVSFEDRKGGKMWHVQFHEAILPAKGSAFSFKEAIKKGRKKLGQF